MNTSADTCGFTDNERTFHVLNLQNEIMEKISLIQESVKNAVMNRQWTDFEALFETMNQYGDQFLVLETERSALFAKSGVFSDINQDFYSKAARLPEEERSKMTELYRNLKLRTMKVKIENESLVHYLDEAKTTVNSFLDAAYPDRKNRFYSRSGSKVDTDMRSMVINHSL